MADCDSKAHNLWPLFSWQHSKTDIETEINIVKRYSNHWNTNCPRLLKCTCFPCVYMQMVATESCSLLCPTCMTPPSPALWCCHLPQHEDWTVCCSVALGSPALMMHWWQPASPPGWVGYTRGGKAPPWLGCTAWCRSPETWNHPLKLNHRPGISTIYN